MAVLLMMAVVAMMVFGHAAFHFLVHFFDGRVANFKHFSFHEKAVSGQRMAVLLRWITKGVLGLDGEFEIFVGR